MNIITRLKRLRVRDGLKHNNNKKKKSLRLDLIERNFNHKTRKLFAIYKALHSSDDVDRSYVKGQKKREEE